MSQIAIITDTHFGVKNDAPFMLDYQEKFYKHIFFPYLIKNNIKTVFHLGDLFDRRKYINFMTLNRTKQMFLNMLRDYDIQMYIIPGNHDVYFKNSNEIGSLTELLGEYTNITLIEKPTDIVYDGISFAFIPWINNENYIDTMNFVNSSKSEILCGHLELKNFEMYAGVKNEHGMDPLLFSKYEQVWSGHFHHKSAKDNIRYLGSPMEFTFADCGDARGFHTFDTDTKDLTFHINSFTLHDKIHYSDETEELQEYFRTLDCSQYTNKIVKLFVARKTKPAIFEYFIDNLYKESLHDLTIMEDYSEFHESFVDLEVSDQSTKELMEKYVDTVDTDMQKNKLKSILNGLYMEALHGGSDDPV